MGVRHGISIAGFLLALTACGGMSANQGSSRGPASSGGSVFMTTSSVGGSLVPLLRFYYTYGGNIVGGGHKSQPFDVNYPQLADGAEGGLVMVSLDPGPGLHAVYTCVLNLTTQTQPYTSYGRIFSSADPNCEGQVQMPTFFGINQFYLADSPIEGMSRPLFRCVDGNADHLDTTDPNECAAAGYRLEGLLGYGG